MMVPNDIKITIIFLIFHPVRICTVVDAEFAAHAKIPAG